MKDESEKINRPEGPMGGLADWLRIAQRFRASQMSI
jgi:hypothetical protein